MVRASPDFDSFSMLFVTYPHPPLHTHTLQQSFEPPAELPTALLMVIGSFQSVREHCLRGLLPVLNNGSFSWLDYFGLLDSCAHIDSIDEILGNHYQCKAFQHNHHHRDEICQCRHCRWQCKIFASGVNFSRNNAIYNI